VDIAKTLFGSEGLHNYMPQQYQPSLYLPGSMHESVVVLFAMDESEANLPLVLLVLGPPEATCSCLCNDFALVEI
jgi:hypothetical protein